MTKTWPNKMTKTRQEMNDLDLPGRGPKDLAVVVSDRIVEKSRWSTISELIFRLPGMPDDLAYRTTYSKGSTECQDEQPWEHEPAECVLVRKVPKVIETWTTDPVDKILDLRALAWRQIREFVPHDIRGEMSSHMCAENMTPEWHQRLTENAGQRVRVRRVVTYEGDNTAVLQNLAMSLPPGKTYGNATCKTTVEEIEYGRIVEPPPRIEVCRLDPDTLVGIALCDDGSGTWVVMRQDGEGNAEPVGDDLGAIAYVDILDAAEVLKTGIVWKHDMGESEADEP